MTHAVNHDYKKKKTECVHDSRVKKKFISGEGQTETDKQEEEQKLEQEPASADA